MFKISVADMVQREQYRASQENHWKHLDYNKGIHEKGGVLVSLDLSLSDNDTSRSIRRMVYFVMCGNTNVFAAVSEERFFNNIPVEDFKNISNHDSCWRDSIEQFLNKLYFDWSEKINPEKAPIDLFNYCWSLSRNVSQKVLVQYKRKKDDNYFNDLTNVSFCDHIPHNRCAPNGMYRILKKVKDQNLEFVADIPNLETAKIVCSALLNTFKDEETLYLCDKHGRSIFLM